MLAPLFGRRPPGLVGPGFSSRPRVLRLGGRPVQCWYPSGLCVRCRRSRSRVRALVNPYFGLDRIHEGDGAATFVLGYGDWIRLLRERGLSVENHIELRPPEGASSAINRLRPWSGPGAGRSRRSRWRQGGEGLVQPREHLDQAIHLLRPTTSATTCERPSAVGAESQSCAFSSQVAVDVLSFPRLPGHFGCERPNESQRLDSPCVLVPPGAVAGHLGPLSAPVWRHDDGHAAGWASGRQAAS